MSINILGYSKHSRAWPRTLGQPTQGRVSVETTVGRQGEGDKLLEETDVYWHSLPEKHFD